MHLGRLAGVIALAALVAGCGSSSATKTVTESSDPATTGEAPPTKAAYIAQLDKLCGRAQSESQGLAKDLEAAVDQVNTTGSSMAYDHLADVLGQLLAVGRPIAQEERSVPHPAGDDSALRDVDDSQVRGIALFEQAQQAASDHDADRITTYFEDASRTADRLSGLRQGYGFKVCGTG